MKKLLLVAAMAFGGVVSLSFAVALGRFAAYRDNRIKCDDAKSDVEKFSVELPDGVVVCRKTERSESADIELVVETPGALCLLSSGLAFCPSIVKNQLAFIHAMDRAGWDRTSAYGPDEVRFSRGKGTTVTVRLRQSSYGEVDATMNVYMQSAKVGKQ